MRLVTYAGLVARRVWAKRGVLFGSLLGATLVTALLVIVPLYEASVQAVDLLFTLRGAAADEVDVTAFSQTLSYDGEVAAGNRTLVTDVWQERLDQWYPTVVERSQSREFSVIPIDGAVDWLGLAEEWRAEVDALVAAGAEPEALPEPPFPRPPREATQVRFLTAPDIDDHLVVVRGEWPVSQAAPSSSEFAAPLRIAIGADLADRIQRDVGDRFVLRPISGLPEIFELVEIAAVVEAADAGDVIWGIDLPGAMAYVPLETWDTWTGPLAISPTGDPWRRTQRGLTDQTVTQRFVIQFDPETVELEQLTALANQVAAFRADLSRDSGGEIAANTLLGNILDAFTTRSVTVGAPILAVLALVVGGALYFLVYTAALTLEREGPEIALLRTRGASSWQTIGIHVTQSLVIAGVAAVVAPFVARAMVGITGRVPPLSDLTGGALRVAQVRSIVPFVLAGAFVTFAAMGLAILPFARRKVLELRSLAARPARSSVWQRYNLDLFAVGLSLVVLFQLAQRGFINTSEGEVKLDPLAIIFPALLLFTGALVLLRLLPWVLRLAGWVMVRARSMSAALPGWHLGRNPIPYGRLALLVWLTTGLGAFALTYANTLNGSFNDRAAFVSGAELRVVGDNAGLIAAPEGTVATGVLRTNGAPRQSSRQAEVLAVRPTEFSDVVTWRSDFGAPPRETFAPLREDGPPDVGAEVPADGSALRVDGVVIPRSLAEQAAVGDAAPDHSLRLMLEVFDGRSRLWTMQADRDFVDTEWRTVEVDFAAAGLNTIYSSPPEPPYSIHAMWLERSAQTGGALIDGEQVLVADFRIVTSGGVEAFSDNLDELTTANGIRRFRDVDAGEAVDAYFSDLPDGMEPPAPEDRVASPLARDGLAVRWELPLARTRADSAVPSFRRLPDPVRVLLDAEVAGRAGLLIGDESSYTIAGEIVEGVFVGFVDRVPTMNDPTREGKMVVDRDALTAWLDGAATWSFNTSLARLQTPGELWVATDDPDAALRRLTAAFPPGVEPDRVFSIEGSSSEFSSRPVQVGLVAILFVGAATSVVLALAGVTSYVLLAVARRAREMGVLRALGLQRREVAATFAIEQVVVVGIGALVGTFGGIALMWSMLPFLQLGEAAEVVEPPIRLERAVAVAGRVRRDRRRPVDRVSGVVDASSVGTADERGPSGGRTLMAPIIDCRNLIKIHKQGNLEVVALHGLDFTMEEGEFISVVGKSGAGKSTLLTILAGLDVPSAGAVEVTGIELTGLGERAMVQHYRRNVGFLWQDFARNLLPYLKAIDNVELPMLLAGVGARRRRSRARALLEAVGLRNQAYARLNTMSGGEQQRLALCVALALGPKLLLADEPTGELDTETSLGIYEVLRRLNREGGLSILVVTHDVALAQRTDRVVRLADGKVVGPDHHRESASVEVGPHGAVEIPRDMLIEAGIGDRAKASMVEEGILLQPEDTPDGP